MQKIVLGLMLLVGSCSIDHSDMAMADEPQCFWPPDMVPHPNPPWDQPKDPNEGDLA